jgi:hypothetical protein
MAYVRKKRNKGHDYFYLVESYRKGGKVRTRTLKYLGTSPDVPIHLRHLLGPKRNRLQPLLGDPAASCLPCPAQAGRRRDRKTGASRSPELTPR